MGKIIILIFWIILPFVLQGTDSPPFQLKWRGSV
jgi:hypothetical protein